MTVDNPKVIDFVTYDPKSDIVSLALVEHRAWGPDGQLLPDLQAKLNTYLSYAVDGPFASDYPDLQGKPLRFDLRTAHPLGPRELEFIDIVRRRHLSPRGIQFTWKLYDTHAASTVEGQG